MAELLPFKKATGVPDQAERDTALDITRSWIVEAPAGSGKTALLIQRFLKLLATRDVIDPRQVLAITFTRKATHEMRDRVFAQLVAAHANTTPGNAFDRATRPLAEAVLRRDTELGWRLLDQPMRLNIRTIDAVSMEIAANLPVLSGSGGGKAPAEDASALHAEAARRTLMLMGGEDHALTQALQLILLHRDGNLGNCEALIASMLAARDQWGELIPLSRAELDDHFLDTVVLPRLERALDVAICNGLTRLTKVLPAAILNRLCELAAEMGDLEGYKGDPSPIAICAGRRESPEAQSAHLDHWRALVHLLITPSSQDWRVGLNTNHVKFMLNGTHRATMKLLIAEMQAIAGLREALCHIESLPPASYPAEQWRVAKALFRVLSRALTELQLVFAERGECDFAEVALLARAALLSDSAADDLSAASGFNLQHLLVDEMQDTSSSQYELIQLLTQRWDGHSQTVFLVGDPKQSIYLFRQARVERFVQTMHLGKLGDLPLGVIRLTANFRSQAPLIDAFNADFSLLFPARPDPLQPELVPYQPACAVREGVGQRVWHTAVVPHTSERALMKASARDQAVQQAQQVRGIIEAWRSRPLPDGRQEPWRIAVLVRNRSHLLDIVAALKQPAAIPYRAVDIEPLAERQEILDLLALTRALPHPADRAAWIGLLRSPWCGLSLADLHRLMGQDDESFAEATVVQLLQSRGDLLSEDGIQRLKPFWTIMDAALSYRARLSIAEWVERTWRAFGAPLFISEEALANAGRFIDLLDELEESTGVLDLEILDKRLGKLYASASVNPDAVDLLTIHKAKGLEWDVVLVPALERTSQNSQSKLLEWLETDGGNDVEDAEIAHGMIAPISSKGGASGELNAWMRSVVSAREAAERKRLFYVACTRAREELHLFACPEERKDGTLSVRTDSLLAAAWPAAEPHFATTSPGVAPRSTSTPPARNVIQMQQPFLDQRIDRLAAEGASAGGQAGRTIERIPLQYLAGNGSETGPTSELGKSRFDRPEGSFAARAFGNGMHAFLEVLAKRVAEGTTVAELLGEIPEWAPRVAAVLRASGLGGTEVERFAAAILRGLAKTLNDTEGRWILAAHPEAASERSLVTWTEQGERSSIRLDRTFLGGATPLEAGGSHLWIVDYKTASHGAEGFDAFLVEERRKYSPQLETYARELAGGTHPIRLALFYPMLPALVWWEPEAARSV